MSVILTGTKFPYMHSCVECTLMQTDHDYNHWCPFRPKEVYPSFYDIPSHAPSTCPLKSVDELLDKLSVAEAANRRYDTPDRVAKADGLHEALEIVKEFCKETEYGK